MALKPTYHSSPLHACIHTSIFATLSKLHCNDEGCSVGGGAFLLSLITPMGTGDYRIGKGLGIESEVS